MTTEEVAKLVRSRIQKELTFNLRSKDHEEMIKLNDKKYRYNEVF